MYLFGAFLLFTGFKLAVSHDSEMDPSQNLALRLARRFLPISENLDGDHFFTRVGKRSYVTPLFLVLLVVEFTDVLFAVDSVPAVLAVTNDLFVVYASNVFAILGLRALYFVLADAMGKFGYLGIALSIILMFIGAKMLLNDVFQLPNTVSLAVIIVTLGVAIAASVYKTNTPRSSKQTPPG
jgi:tellurite resistance protein TerC